MVSLSLPSQDMVLGNYYLTLERKDAVNTGAIFNDTNEVLKAYANGYVHLHSYWCTCKLIQQSNVH